MRNPFKKVSFVHQLFFILFISIAYTIAVCRAHQLGNDNDHAALLAIKSQLLDHSAVGVFRSWNHSLHHCAWDGVTCGPKHNRVIMLNLSSRGLVGTISPFIGNLSFLQDIELHDNSLVGHIPSELGRLFRLESLQVANNEISGTIPISILNCSLLEIIDLSYNKLSGEIPGDIGLRLPHLVNLQLTTNQFSGTFPNSLLNLTNIESLSLAENNFVGRVPLNFGSRLHNLAFLELHTNYIEGDINFISSLVNSTNLRTLELGVNNFTGIIPESIANLSIRLESLELQNCGTGGKIPKHISNLISLRALVLDRNELVGSIPQDFGMLHNLEHIDFRSNKLTNGIPESLNNMSRLSTLYLSDNELEGSIPPSLGDCPNLLYLYVTQNRLNGTLQIFKGSNNFIEVDLSYNLFEGSIPEEISNKINLVELSVAENKLSGIIPDGLGHCVSLQVLYIRGNFFHGDIPASFSTLGSLQFLDLSSNNLSGTIPNYFSKFSQLEQLNLSNNNFDGEVPKSGVFANISVISVDGNVKLCGGLPELHLPRCKKAREMKKGGKTHLALKLIVSIICALVGVLIITACLYFTCHKKKRPPTSSGSAKVALMKVSYDMLLKATNGFSPENLVGAGSFGSVFKGTLDGDIVAVKVLNLQKRGAPKSFMAECKALRNVRHRNLVGIITACSSTDYQRNDFKALVYEFMPNGSLDGWLHGNRVESLTLLQRVDIAIDVAHALSYLHHDCEIPIVHCDLKPTNVLLDEDMVARVGDFRLTKFLDNSQHYQSSSIGVRGTVGYAAPEYGLGSEPCTDGDIYSYGILVLELMTGKRPTDNMFHEDYNLHSYTDAAFPDNILDILDPTQLEDDIKISEEEADDKRVAQATNQQRFECMVDVMSVGVGCSKHLPQDRMRIREAIGKLQAARDNLCNVRRNRNI